MTDGVRLRTDALRVVEGSGNGRGESHGSVAGESDHLLLLGKIGMGKRPDTLQVSG